MKWTPWILLLGLLCYAGAQSCRDKQVWSAWEQDTLRLLRTVDGLKSQRAIVERERDSLRSIAIGLTREANRQHRSVLQLKGEGDSLKAVLDSATNAPDSLQAAITAAERYRVALDTALTVIEALRGAYAAQQREAVVLTTQLHDHEALVDSLAAVIRRTPSCRRIPLLGICAPKVGISAGYGMVLSDGQVRVGPGIQVGLTLPIGKAR